MRKEFLAVLTVLFAILAVVYIAAATQIEAEKLPTNKDHAHD